MDIIKKIQTELFAFKDEKYKEFNSKLIPNIFSDKIIGVRIPKIRALAKQYKNNEQIDDFLSALPHKFLEENLLHVFIVNEIKDYHDCLEKIKSFLPFIDNWAVCDALRPKCFTKNTDILQPIINEMLHSNHPYIIRFAISVLMLNYLDDNFNISQLENVASIRSTDYYVNMMRAWYFATALAKQYDSTISILKNKQLDKWTHNKTIQKASESFRINEPTKTYLKTLRLT